VAQPRPGAGRTLHCRERCQGPARRGVLGAVGGGLWKTADSGENWAPVTDGQIRVNNRLASLLSAVGNGDGKPIGNAAAIFKDLSGELKVQTDRLQHVLTSDLPAFNAEAKRAGLGGIAAKPLDMPTP
jgi:hypothetical protein